MFDYNFHWRPVLKSLPDLLAAGLTTLEIAALSMALGIIFGLGLALIQMHMRRAAEMAGISLDRAGA